MKNYWLILIVCSAFLLVSCTTQHEKSTVTTKEHTTVTTPENPSPPPNPKEEDGTTIKMNEEGVSFSNKDGDEKREVNISDDSTNIEIKNR